jgi:hypothetical protein
MPERQRKLEDKRHQRQPRAKFEVFSKPIHAALRSPATGQAPQLSQMLLYNMEDRLQCQLLAPSKLQQSAIFVFEVTNHPSAKPMNPLRNAAATPGDSLPIRSLLALYVCFSMKSALSSRDIDYVAHVSLLGLRGSGPEDPARTRHVGVA